MTNIPEFPPLVFLNRESVLLIPPECTIALSQHSSLLKVNISRGGILVSLLMGKYGFF
jgi:hypothetical protein